VKPWQIDPTKWIIWILSKVGFATKLLAKCSIVSETEFVQQQTRSGLRANGSATALGEALASSAHADIGILLGSTMRPKS
jgi:hypothetical protein